MGVPAGGNCPLCHQDNQCAIAGTGDAQAPCWCRDVSMPDDVLRRVPEPGRPGSTRACICRNCAMPSTA